MKVKDKDKKMRKFIMPQRDQLFLMLQGNLESVAPIGSALRHIDELVNALDITDIEKKYDLESPVGQEPIYPKTLIKVALYSIHNCRFSLRKMEHDTHYHLGYKWITGNQGIDHSTMGKFLDNNKEELAELFEQVVEIGVEKELLDFEILAVDTVKIRANASYKQFRDEKGLEKERVRIKERIKELIEKAGEDEIEKEEKLILEKRGERLEEAKKELQKRSGENKKSKGKEKINLTDFDCKLVQQANGETNSGYAITTTVDSGCQLITGFQINDEVNDAAILLPAIEESEKNSGDTHETVVADSGFSSLENLEELSDHVQKALIPDKRLEVEERGETAKGKYDRSEFKYNEEKNCYKCPEGKILRNLGEAEQNGRKCNRYGNKEACKNCKHLAKCTKGKNRIISRDKQEWLKEEMREELHKKRNEKIYNQRAPIVESPYGQIKHNLKYRIFMRRGRLKIQMEASLLFMLHNILKIGKLSYAMG